MWSKRWRLFRFTWETENYLFWDCNCRRIAFCLLCLANFTTTNVCRNMTTEEAIQIALGNISPVTRKPYEADSSTVVIGLHTILSSQIDLRLVKFTLVPKIPNWIDFCERCDNSIGLNTWKIKFFCKYHGYDNEHSNWIKFGIHITFFEI